MWWEGWPIWMCGAAVAIPFMFLAAIEILLYQSRQERSPLKHVPKFRIYDALNRRSRRKRSIKGLAQQRTYVMVIGGDLVAKRLVAILAKDSCKCVRMFDKRVPPSSKRLPEVTYYVGDIRNYEHLMASLHGVSVVYQCCSAGEAPLVGMSENAIHDAVVKGTANVLRACRSYGVIRYLFTSSALVTVRKGEKAPTADAVAKAKAAGEPNPWAPWTEDRPLPPKVGGKYLSFYCQALAEAESLVLEANGKANTEPISDEEPAGSRLMHTCVLRPSHVFGLKQERHGVKFMSLLLQGLDCVCPTTNAQLDLVHADSVVMGHLYAERKLRVAPPMGSSSSSKISFGDAPVAAGRTYHLTSDISDPHLDPLANGPTSTSPASSPLKASSQSQSDGKEGGEGKGHAPTTTAAHSPASSPGAGLQRDLKQPESSAAATARKLSATALRCQTVSDSRPEMNFTLVGLQELVKYSIQTRGAPPIRLHPLVISLLAWLNELSGHYLPTPWSLCLCPASVHQADPAWKVRVQVPARKRKRSSRRMRQVQEAKAEAEAGGRGDCGSRGAEEPSKVWVTRSYTFSSFKAATELGYRPIGGGDIRTTLGWMVEEQRDDDYHTRAKRKLTKRREMLQAEEEEYYLAEEREAERSRMPRAPTPRSNPRSGSGGGSGGGCTSAPVEFTSQRHIQRTLLQQANSPSPPPGPLSPNSPSAASSASSFSPHPGSSARKNQQRLGGGSRTGSLGPPSAKAVLSAAIGRSTPSSPSSSTSSSPSPVRGNTPSPNLGSGGLSGGGGSVGSSPRSSPRSSPQSSPLEGSRSMPLPAGLAAVARGAEAEAGVGAGAAATGTASTTGSGSISDKPKPRPTLDSLKGDTHAGAPMSRQRRVPCRAVTRSPPTLAQGMGGFVPQARSPISRNHGSRGLSSPVLMAASMDDRSGATSPSPDAVARDLERSIDELSSPEMSPQFSSRPSMSMLDSPTMAGTSLMLGGNCVEETTPTMKPKRRLISPTPFALGGDDSEGSDSTGDVPAPLRLRLGRTVDAIMDEEDGADDEEVSNAHEKTA